MKFSKLYPKNPVVLMLLVFVIAGLLGFGVISAASAIHDRHSASNSNCATNVVCVNLYSDHASPDTVTVKNGQYVQFNSADGNTHDLSQGTGGEHHDHIGHFESGEFKAGEAWKVKFEKDGAYDFHDHLNPKISMIVVVYTPGKDYKIH